MKPFQLGGFMSFRFIFCICISLSLVACQAQKNINQQARLQQEAISVVRQFAGMLKPRLKYALQHGGPSRAIEVCSKAAPELAAQLSKKSGWKIKRVSLKARNHHTAIPDAWEKSVLHQFDREQAAGKSPANMVASRVKHGVYRFMKAQPVSGICLICHGENLSPDVLAALRKYYPEDQATGYKLGQIRGAFSLTRQLHRQTVPNGNIGRKS